MLDYSIFIPQEIKPSAINHSPHLRPNEPSMFRRISEAPTTKLHEPRIFTRPIENPHFSSMLQQNQRLPCSKTNSVAPPHSTVQLHSAFRHKPCTKPDLLGKAIWCGTVPRKNTVYILKMKYFKIRFIDSSCKSVTTKGNTGLTPCLKH